MDKVAYGDKLSQNLLDTATDHPGGTLGNLRAQIYRAIIYQEQGRPKVQNTPFSPNVRYALRESP